MPALPRASMRFDEKFQLVDDSGCPLANRRVQVVKEGGPTQEFVTDSTGHLPIQQSFGMDRLTIRIFGKANQGSPT